MKKSAAEKTTLAAATAFAEEAAQRYLRVETLETRHSDCLDFHEVSVWALREALEQAYLAGRNAR